MNSQRNNNTNIATTTTKSTTKQKKPIQSHNINRSRHKNTDKRQDKHKDNATSTNKNKKYKRKNNKTKKFTSSYTASTINNSQRLEDIKQCQTLFSSKQFKLFNDDKISTQFGFTLDNKTNSKYVIVIPNNYPNHPIKLLNQMNDQKISDPLGYRYLINNFNKKCKVDDSKKICIASQLNDLSVNHDILMSQSPQDFNNYMHLHKSFYNQFK